MRIFHKIFIWYNDDFFILNSQPNIHLDIVLILNAFCIKTDLLMYEN